MKKKNELGLYTSVRKLQNDLEYAITPLSSASVVFKADKYDKKAKLLDVLHDYEALRGMMNAALERSSDVLHKLAGIEPSKNRKGRD